MPLPRIEDRGYAVGILHHYDELDEGGLDPHRVTVFVPRKETYGEGPLPVVYMNDGHALFDNGLGGSWNVHQAVEESVRGGRSPVVVVGIYPRHRGHEYLHVSEMDGMSGRAGGGIWDYAAYLDRLIRFVESTYPVMKHREGRAIIGSSHGGLAAFLLGALRPETYGFVGALSPSFWAGGMFDVERSYLIEVAGPGLRSTHRPRLWLDYGLKRWGGPHNFVFEAQATRWTKKLANHLRSAYGYRDHVDLYVHEDPQGEHDERSWAKRLRMVLPVFLRAV